MIAVLIGIQFCDLSLRSRCLLVLASLSMLAGMAMLVLAPDPAVRLMQVWLLAIVLLGLYWLSFLMDFRARLARSQLLVASLFALLPWVLVIALILGYPQILFPSGTPAP